MQIVAINLYFPFAIHCAFYYIHFFTSKICRSLLATNNLRSLLPLNFSMGIHTYWFIFPFSLCFFFSFFLSHWPEHHSFRYSNNIFHFFFFSPFFFSFSFFYLLTISHSFFFFYFRLLSVKQVSL